MRIKILIFCVYMILSQPSFADSCEIFDFQKLKDQLGVDISLNLKACKVMPDFPNKAIVSFLDLKGEVSPHDSSEEEASAYNLVVFILDVSSGKIISRLDDGKLNYAGGTPTEIVIDTAKYYVGKKQRAFGVRIETRFFSSLTPQTDQWLNLYLADNSRIRNVLRGFAFFSEGNGYDGQCEYNGHRNATTLKMLAESTNGFFDIEALTKMKSSSSKMVDGECKELPDEEITQKSILKYIDGVYLIKNQSYGL